MKKRLPRLLLSLGLFYLPVYLAVVLLGKTAYEQVVKGEQPMLCRAETPKNASGRPFEYRTNYFGVGFRIETWTYVSTFRAGRMMTVTGRRISYSKLFAPPVVAEWMQNDFYEERQTRNPRDRNDVQTVAADRAYQSERRAMIIREGMETGVFLGMFLILMLCVQLFRGIRSKVQPETSAEVGETSDTASASPSGSDGP